MSKHEAARALAHEPRLSKEVENYMLLTVCTLIRYGDKVLAVVGPNGAVFPGGKVEAKDYSTRFELMLINAARREVLEETQLNVYGLVPIHSGIDENGNHNTVFAGDVRQDLIPIAEPGFTIQLLKFPQFMQMTPYKGFYRKMAEASNLKVLHKDGCIVGGCKCYVD